MDETPAESSLPNDPPSPTVEAAPSLPTAATPAPAAPAKPSAEELKAALKAFKKRIKVTQLDQDSRVGRSPLTGGKSQILSITPPNQYPRAVWEALAAEGKLKYVGEGMYELRAP
jgi:hypothetical protein